MLHPCWLFVALYIRFSLCLASETCEANSHCFPSEDVDDPPLIQLAVKSKLQTTGAYVDSGLINDGRKRRQTRHFHTFATNMTWPSFSSPEDLRLYPEWFSYLQSVYGPSVDDPQAFPIDISKFVTLQTDKLAAANLTVASAAGCPEQMLEPFPNWINPPPNYLWINQPKRDSGFPDQSRVEVAHVSDPIHGPDADEIQQFEAKQYWMYYAPGSGIFYNLGRTKVFQLHRDAVEEFLPANHSCQGIDMVGDCVKEAFEVAKEQYDSLQFLSHADQLCSYAINGSVTPVELVDLHHSGFEACSIPVDGGIGKNVQACNCNSSFNWLNCQFSFPVALINTPPTGSELNDSSTSIEDKSSQQNHVVVLIVAGIAVLGTCAFLVQAILEATVSPVALAGLSCIFFGSDNFLIAYAGKYLRLPNAHMALMFFFMGLAAFVMHIILVARSSRYNSQVRVVVNSSKGALFCVPLTALFIVAALVCSNVGFSMKLPESGPHQALASCSVLVVGPFFYIILGETLNRLQLSGCALLLFGTAVMSDVLHWSQHPLTRQGFLWILVAMFFYSASDITLRFASVAGMPWQPRILYMLILIGILGFPMFFMDREKDGFDEYYRTPSLAVWPLLNGVFGSLGLLCATLAFDDPKAPTGVLTAIVNANSVVLVLLNKVIFDYNPSPAKLIGMGFILLGLLVFHVADSLDQVSSQKQTQSHADAMLMSCKEGERESEAMSTDNASAIESTTASEEEFRC